MSCKISSMFKRSLTFPRLEIILPVFQVFQSVGEPWPPQMGWHNCKWASIQPCCKFYFQGQHLIKNKMWHRSVHFLKFSFIVHFMCYLKLQACKKLEQPFTEGKNEKRRERRKNKGKQKDKDWTHVFCRHQLIVYLKFPWNTNIKPWYMYRLFLFVL